MPGILIVLFAWEKKKFGVEGKLRIDKHSVNNEILPMKSSYPGVSLPRS